jgi:hypothetical protein
MKSKGEEASGKEEKNEEALKEQLDFASHSR